MLLRCQLRDCLGMVGRTITLIAPLLHLVDEFVHGGDCVVEFVLQTVIEHIFKVVAHEVRVLLPDLS